MFEAREQAHYRSIRKHFVVSQVKTQPASSSTNTTQQPSKMDEAAAAEQQQPSVQSFLNLEFFRDTWVGRLKIFELLFCLITAALVPASVYGHEAGFGFMSFVAWTAFICTLIDCFLHLIRDIWEKMVLLREHPEIYMVLCLLATIGLCLGSIIELAVANYAEDPHLARASGVFGFLVMLAFVIEAFLHFQSFKQKVEERRERQERSGTHQPDEVFTDIRYDA
jgi:heme exporter protein D